MGATCFSAQSRIFDGRVLGREVRLCLTLPQSVTLRLHLAVELLVFVAPHSPVQREVLLAAPGVGVPAAPTGPLLWLLEARRAPGLGLDADASRLVGPRLLLSRGPSAGVLRLASSRLASAYGVPPDRPRGGGGLMVPGCPPPLVVSAPRWPAADAARPLAPSVPGMKWS